MELKEKLTESMKRRTRQNHYLFVIAGGYLLYLAYSLFIRFGTEVSGVLFLIAPILFTIIGAAILVYGLFALSKNYYVGGAKEEDSVQSSGRIGEPETLEDQQN